ncbi:M61 family metallopeptidase [Sphingomonas sp. BK580]|uniref:M61 family metallopeptidase n=1 Tax=Sphingomonas sp. BK580 TaxID=2586972 RepID=UPI0016093D05|nr:M61 family metallopeptidase [Sphingomonas sp. BK580]
MRVDDAGDEPAAFTIPEPADRPYGHPLALHVDASDRWRGILRVSERVPVDAPGDLILLYPKWLPGFHAPVAPIELLAGLHFEADGRALEWRRHPVMVHAFAVSVPDGVAAVTAEFQFLSPTDPAQGRVISSPEMLLLPWNATVLYPAGHAAGQIMLDASLTLPEGWSAACAIASAHRKGERVVFERSALDTLVDSPVLAGRHMMTFPLEKHVSLHVAADEPRQTAFANDQLALHRAVVAETVELFGSRSFDRFEMLLALSDTLTAAGVEHHRSFEAVTVPGYVTDWDKHVTRRDTIPHEFVHSWNGKHRRGADSCAPSFDRPIRNDLLWVYEGQTQYWTNVLCARSGLWTEEETLGALALTAARYEARPGSRWRPLLDTTRDPIIAARSPLPWPSWQRSEDYYAEGALLWLEVDTRLRELSGDTRSLDDFARSFFGGAEGDWSTRPYDLEEVADRLDAIAPFHWRAFLLEAVHDTREGTLLGGLSRGGYRLDYAGTLNAYQRCLEGETGIADLTHTIGLSVGGDGRVTDVLWGGAAFDAGVTIGTVIVAVDRLPFSVERLRAALTDRADKRVEMVVRRGATVRTIALRTPGHLRYPRLVRVLDQPDRLSAILRPRRVTQV